MASILERPDASQVYTLAQDFTTRRYLGTLGHIVGLKYSYACPGGCDQMSATLQIPVRQRTDALNPGRWVHIARGASIIWRGMLDEPQPSASGWNITAHGVGTFGANFAATYTGTWGSGTPDNAVNAAITRGLDWVNPGIGTPSGMWTGQQVDSGAQQITDLLNLICTKGGLTWYVATRPDANVLSVFSLPTAVTNIIVSNTPVARTLGGDLNTIWIRYQSTADAAASPATYSLTSVTDATSIAMYGPLETYMDLSSAQILTGSAARAVGNYVLQRYQRASFAGPFTVSPAQLLTTAGSPVDLGNGMPYAPMVCKLQLTDFGYGGEEIPGAIQFLVGQYEYDDDSQTATITPFQYLRTDFASFLQQIAATEPARKQATTTTKSATHVTRS
jgi:hypothetical protein